MFEFVKNLFKKKPKEPCIKCKDTGTILIPTFQAGSMIMYDGYKCTCGIKQK